MAKKAAVKKLEGAPAQDQSKSNLVETIALVRTLEDFIQERGGLEAALGTVTRVSDLICMTGGVANLKEALEIVGRKEAPAQV